ncbi:hypothetical protein RhiJN_08673 [Ceratobasidium sp. AG-Ba]|nr:hypothetical protein RhiJN_08673 [Ceratobasidium sp. AG-Ba]QRW09451.1 hypothetical protein RhiLY_08450 [Ceratobasidium sp. AG-Ba]
MRVWIASLAVIAATLGLAQQHPDRTTSLNPPPELAKSMDWAALSAGVALPKPATNAQRLARGLPLIKPKTARRHSHRRGPHRLGSHVLAAPRAQPSPEPPVSKQCNIAVTSSPAGDQLGLLAAVFNRFGEYGAVVSTTNPNPLVVSFSYSLDSTEQLDLTAVNGPSTAQPFFGTAVGYGSSNNDMSSTSPNYLIIVGTTQTPPGSPPSDEADNTFSQTTSIPVAAESAVWVYDPVTQALTIRWVNTDGTPVDLSILLCNQSDDFLVATGNPALFTSTFGANCPAVTLSCVPPV